jgi:hypothetical protein
MTALMEAVASCSSLRALRSDKRCDEPEAFGLEKRESSNA